MTDNVGSDTRAYRIEIPTIQFEPICTHLNHFNLSISFGTEIIRIKSSSCVFAIDTHFFLQIDV